MYLKRLVLVLDNLRNDEMMINPRGSRMERERRERSRVRVRGSMSGRLLTSMSPTPPNRFFTIMIKNKFLASLDDTILSLHVFSLSLCFSCSVNSSLLVITTFSRAIEIDSEHSENSDFSD